MTRNGWRLAIDGGRVFTDIESGYAALEFRHMMEELLTLWQRGARKISILMLFLFLGACKVPPEPPRDAEMVRLFNANEQCFRQMAGRILSQPEEATVRYSFPMEPSVAADSDVGETTLWKHCMWEIGTEQVSAMNMASAFAEAGETLVAPQHPSDRIVWFYIFRGLLAGGQEKGVLYVANDDLTGIGSVVPSLDAISDTPEIFKVLEPRHTIFFRIKPHWYLFYFYYK